MQHQYQRCAHCHLVGRSYGVGVMGITRATKELVSTWVRYVLLLKAIGDSLTLPVDDGGLVGFTLNDALNASKGGGFGAAVGLNMLVTRFLHNPEVVILIKSGGIA